MKDKAKASKPFAEHAVVFTKVSKVDDRGRGVRAGVRGVIVHVYPLRPEQPATYIVEVAVLDQQGHQTDAHIFDADHDELDEEQKSPPALAIPSEFKAKVEKLLSDRIVFIGTPIDDFIANLVIDQLQVLAKLDGKAPISLYVNSPGGYVSSGLAIFETLRALKNPIHTLGISKVHGMASLLVAAGTKGARSSLAEATFQLCPIEIGEKLLHRKREEVDRLHDRVAEIYAQLTGKKSEEVRADMAMGVILIASEARSYGLIDCISKSANSS